MSVQNLQLGIQAIQKGNREEGARFLRVALRDNEIQGEMRATGLLWLAETTNDPQQKMAYYNQALTAEPGNVYATQRIAAMMSQGLPDQNTPSQPIQAQPAPQPAPQHPPQSAPGYGAVVQPGTQGFYPQPAPQQTPPPSMPGQNHYTQQPQQAYAPIPSQESTAAQQEPVAYRCVGLEDGPNGPATAFFVTRDGLLATTRFAVGGEQTITIELEPRRYARGQVVRSYPELDLALIHTGLPVRELLPAAPQPTIPPDAQISAMPYNGKMLHGQHRATKSQIKPEWFPTTIADLNDAGGNPVFDERNLLVGMLTGNANKTSNYVFGLNIYAINRQVGQYLQEISTGTRRAYCPNCGFQSVAGGAGAFYCENCGGLMPDAENVRRYQRPEMSRFYENNSNYACPNCTSRVGFYNSRCLRCGYQV